MDSASSISPSLIYADGYSYTEFFRVRNVPGIPSGIRWIRVFHTFVSDNQDDLAGADPAPLLLFDIPGNLT